MSHLIFSRTGAWKTSLILWLLVVVSGAAVAERTSDIRSTKHNLSASSSNTVKAATEDEVCVYCHTPHGATSEPGAPLWNRTVGGQSYTKYQSSSLDATSYTDPDGKSKLCLSCHDGMVAIGSVNVSNGSGGDGNPLTDDIPMVAPDATMPSGQGTTTGFTRNLGTDLSNDHPISFLYDDALADRDTELRKPSDVTHLGVSSVGDRPQFPLDENSKMQCTSCHDPHVTGVDQPAGTTLKPGVTDNIKFLRGKRFQMVNPVTSTYTEATDIVCLGCHDKLGQAWNMSAHANETDANEKYEDSAADLREFPRGIKVWQAGCLNCHDTHTVQGSRRLLREGVDVDTTPATRFTAKSGARPAIEQTCYQCHSTSTESILQTNTSVPDIKSEFNRSYKMPITAYDNDEEKHDIGTQPEGGYPFSMTSIDPATIGLGANFIEAPESLGKGVFGSNLNNRHAECTDCHNPHRLLKNERFDGSGGTGKATHDHAPSDALNHNAAPGALKGTFGVEITAWDTIPTAWSGNQAKSFGSLPSVIEIRCGISNIDCDGNDQVTKEYQVCLKCHSNFAYDDNGNPDGDPAGTGRPDALYNDSVNPLDTYTNQAMEFQAPTAHQGETSSMTNSGAHSRYDGQTEGLNNFNHRAWHPVMAKTGRTRGTWGTSHWSAPWKDNLGNQTMMCSDCHNNGTNGKAEGGTVGGPHGSNNRKILRGTWDDSSRVAPAGNFCRDCHNPSSSKDNNNSGMDHATHNGDKTTLLCPFCHIAIPHGWKNKSFVANLNDVGPEVLCRSADVSKTEPACTLNQPIAKGTEYLPANINGGDAKARFYSPPYYLGSYAKVLTWRKATFWEEPNCGSLDSGQSGDTWMGNTCEF